MTGSFYTFAVATKVHHRNKEWRNARNAIFCFIALLRIHLKRQNFKAEYAACLSTLSLKNKLIWGSVKEKVAIFISLARVNFKNIMKAFKDWRVREFSFDLNQVNQKLSRSLEELSSVSILENKKRNKAFEAVSEI